MLTSFSERKRENKRENMMMIKKKKERAAYVRGAFRGKYFVFPVAALM